MTTASLEQGAERGTTATAMGFFVPLLLPPGGSGSPVEVILDWTIAQLPGGAADLDQLVCNGKTLSQLIVTIASCGSAFIA